MSKNCAVTEEFAEGMRMNTVSVGYPEEYNVFFDRASRLNWKRNVLLV